VDAKTNMKHDEPRLKIFLITKEFIKMEFVNKQAVSADGADLASAHDKNGSTGPEAKLSDTNQKHPDYETRDQVAAGQCRSVKSDGSPCRAKALHGSNHCFFHDPESAPEREAARILGVQERSRKAAVLPEDTPNARLTSAADITGLLSETINQVRRGELGPHVSNAVGYLAAILLKAKQQDEVEQRVARLESILHSKWKDPNAAVQAIPVGSFEFVNSTEGVHHES
jgi:hypothetical protein